MTQSVCAFMLVALLFLPSAQAFEFVPRLAYGDDPTTSMTVVWSAPAGSRTHRIEWGPTPALGTEAKAIQRDLGELQIWPVYAELTGLAPDTEYHYKIRMGDVEDKVRTFRTATNQATGFTFVAWGDQSSPGAPEAVGDAPLRVMQLAERQDAGFGLVLGDLSYAGTEEDYWNQYVSLVSPFAATRPLMTVSGNHDLEGFGPDGYRTRFRMPSNEDDRWYSFRFANALFIGLDTEAFCNSDRSTSGRASFRASECPLGVNTVQLEFLRSELAAARADPSITWTIVYHHFGVHSHGKHGPNQLMRQHWAPVYDEFDVDLVLQAHDHLYLRSKPMRANAVDANGTTYVVVGTGGANLYVHGAQQPWEDAFSDKDHGLLRVHVGATRLEGRFVTIKDEVKDNFTIEAPASASTGRGLLPEFAPALPLDLTILLLAAFVVVRARRGR